MPKSILARSERYQRLALYGVSTLLTVAILLATWLFGVAAFKHFQEQQLSRFVQYREQVKAETDELSARLMQFVDLYEGIWDLHDFDSIPLATIRSALRQGNGTILSNASLTATPFSIVSDLGSDQPSDTAELGMLLRIVRELSAAPAIDTRKLGINLSGYLYSPDYRFLASAPPQALPARTKQSIATMAAVRQQSAGIEAILAPYSIDDLRRLRPFWTAQSDFGGPDTVSRIILPMLRDGKRVATIVVTVPEDQFFRVFLKNQRIPGFFLIDNASHAALGYDPGFTRDRALFEAVNANLGEIANASPHLQSWRRGGSFFISQTIEGPGWNAVLAYDWRDVLHALESTYSAGALLCLAVLAALWSSVIYFEYRVAGPMRLSATRLMEVKQFNRTIIDTLPIGIAVVDTAAQRLLLENAVAADMLDRHQGQLQQPLEHGQLYQGMIQRIRRQGSEQLSGLMLDTQGTSHLGLVCSNTRWSGRDVVLLGLVDLSQRIDSEQKLKAAVAEAERANRAKSMFLGLMSHEIRTPLHGAMGHLELLSRGRLDTEERARVALINRSFETLLSLVNDILDLTKIEGGAAKLHLQPVVLSKLVERAAQNFSAAICAKGLDLWCTTDPELDAQVMADEQRLTQILQNLLGNACKFTETGSIVLRGICIAYREQRLQVCLSVEDSGIGIAAAQQARIFKPLTQAEPSISERYGGTGLGLYLCRDLTALMGGSITVESSPGQGSRFQVTLDFPVVAAPASASGLPSAPPVLLCCSTPPWEEVLRARLTHSGWTVLQPGTLPAVPAIRLVALPHALPRTQDLQLDLQLALQQNPAAHTSKPAATIYLSPDGPLVPMLAKVSASAVGLQIHTTSLSSSALWQALRWAATGQAEPHAPPLPDTNPAPLLPGAAQLDVIVADDNPISLALIEQQLQTLGIVRVRTAANGREALALWQQAPADLLISDWQMPECDGPQLLQAIREGDPAARVVLTTALANGDLDTGKQGFDAILHKPIKLADLHQMLASICGSSDAKHQAPTPTVQPLPKSIESRVPMTSVDPQLLRMLADSWQAERQHLDDLLAQRDGVKLRRRLHRLQGGLLAIGLDAPAALTQQLQQQIGAANWGQAEVDYPLLLREIEHVLAVSGMPRPPSIVIQ